MWEYNFLSQFKLKNLQEIGEVSTCSSWIFLGPAEHISTTLFILNLEFTVQNLILYLGQIFYMVPLCPSAEGQEQCVWTNINDV